ncbi:MAG: DUF2905 domain-containing protein [Firmicutes bacterium]|nr:DUF2905 domain-containing protein [Bacillota bacterium]
MPGFDYIGKILMALGGSLFIFGALLFFGGRLFRLGRLPGDILVQHGNFTFYFPILTCIILSLILSVLMNLFRR